MPKKKFRELIFQLLYCFDMTGLREIEQIEGLFTSQTYATAPVMQKAHAAALQIVEKQSTLDSYLNKAAASYSFEKISPVEKNILRLGLFELLFTDLPSKVVICEAIRLVKKFGTPEAGRFINAVLDASIETKQVAL